MTWEEVRIGIIGLGYVGLPLAVEFGRRFATLGFDLKPARISALQAGIDDTREVSKAALNSALHLALTDQLEDLVDCTVYIVTVPTPIDRHKRPDLEPLKTASCMVGKVISRRNVVIFESTVYPGATEEVCVPLIEAESGLRFNVDFFAGYSPERINPGDPVHRLSDIKKVTSGSTPETADFIDALYKAIITAGTHKASSLRVAEAAKVIENTQRDVNIALINELALIFNQLGLDTLEVLEAAGTKWNFLPFRPGLVGGHCIGVDPYYLTHKAQEIGYNPEVILSGRRINDRMGIVIAERVVKLLTQRQVHVVGARILILGLTFKENCPDIRNTRVIDIIRELASYSIQIDVYDPWVNAAEAEQEYGLMPIQILKSATYDAIIITVAHDEFCDMGIAAIRALGKAKCLVFDVKSLFPHDKVDARL